MASNDLCVQSGSVIKGMCDHRRRCAAHVTGTRDEYWLYLSPFNIERLEDDLWRIYLKVMERNSLR